MGYFLQFKDEKIIGSSTGFVEGDFECKEVTKEEYESYQTQEKERLNIKLQIIELERKLKEYDYIGIKIPTGRATKEEYAAQIQQMNEWAEEINILKSKL